MADTSFAKRAANEAFDGASNQAAHRAADNAADEASNQAANEAARGILNRIPLARQHPRKSCRLCALLQRG